jgi:beta-lactamase regulating signal transducer with metallopeptidase domain
MRSELLRHLLTLMLASSLGILTALALRRGIRGMFGASASYALWLLAPIAMLSVVLPHAHFTASSAPINAWPMASSAVTHALDRSFDSLAVAAPVASDPRRWTLGVWGFGAALFAGYLVALQHAFVRSLGTLSGLRCVLRAQHSVGCPALIGVLRPKVILPADFRLRYTRLERLLVLAHERTHLRRGDATWNALVALLRCLFWFNPLIHVAARYFRFDQELACDAAVLAARPGSRRPYASAMLKTQLTEGALPLGCHWRSAQDLKERLRMVNRRAPNRRRRLIGGALTTLLAVVVGFTAWAAEPVAGGTTTVAGGPTTGGQPQVGWTAAWAGWLSSPQQGSDQPVIIAMHDARLFLPAGVTLEANADAASRQGLHLHGQLRLMGPAAVSAGREHGQATTLEGHVQLIFTSPTAGSARPQKLVVETDRAVLVGHTDGSSVVQIDEANMHTLLAPQFLYLGTSQTFSQLLTTPDSITVNLKDADISQAAAAVQLATHRTIIVDPRVHAQLTMVSTIPMTPGAFYEAFVGILRTRGFVAMPVGPEGNVVSILPAAND